MANSNSNLSLSNEMQSDIALIQDLLSELSGEDKMQLAHLSEDELLTKLSYCLECEKEDLMNLLASHDQNLISDMVTVAMLWKQVKRGVVKGQKSVFASLPQPVHENILWKSILKFKDNKEAEFKSVTNKPISRSVNVSNDWNKIVQNTAPVSMVDKVEASRAQNDNTMFGVKN